MITKLKSNMKGQIMAISDKILLRKRALIEPSMMNSRIWLRLNRISPYENGLVQLSLF